MASELVNSVSLPPGPKGHFLFGTFAEYTRDILGFLNRCAQEYGDIVYLRGMRFTGIRGYILNHPEYIEEVLTTKSHQFCKYKQGFGIIGRILGNGLVTSEGDFWRHQRRLIQPAFHRERIAAYGEVMVAYTNRMIAQWQNNQIHDIHEDMMRLTLEIAAKTLFDADIADRADEVGSALAFAIEYYDQWQRNLIMTLLPESFPTPGNMLARKVVEQLDAIAYNIRI